MTTLEAIKTLGPDPERPDRTMKPYYADDAVTIFCGDCREIVPTLGRFDLLLTDPPYGIGFGQKHTKWSANRGVVLGEWDAETPDIAWLLDVAPLACVWGGERFGLPVSRGWLAWVKPDAPPTFTAFELAWTNRDVPAKWIKHSISATNRERVGHPTQKPLCVMSWSIQQVGPDAMTILDPFAGSGTTGRAAKDLGRKAVLIEREEKYCEIAARRMQQEVLPMHDRPPAQPVTTTTETLMPLSYEICDRGLDRTQGVML